MARAAATEFGADWVINSDADEFWWPRGHDLKSVLGALPSVTGSSPGSGGRSCRSPDDGSPFYERMTVRFAPSHPVNDPTSKFRPNTKVAHRADPEVTVGRGNHTSVGSHHLLLRGWYPIEILHFPFRSPAQLEVKSVKSDTHAGPKRGGYLRRLATEAEAQAGDDVFAGMALDAAAVEEGLATRRPRAGSAPAGCPAIDRGSSLGSVRPARMATGPGSRSSRPRSSTTRASPRRWRCWARRTSSARCAGWTISRRRLQALEGNPALRVGRSLRSVARRAVRRR